MYRRRTFRRSVRRRNRWKWIRNTVNNAAPSGSLNSIDLLSNFKTHAGITIVLPELVIWRIRLRLAITVTITGGVTSSNDGVLVTSFVDGANQAILSQLLNSDDEQDLVYAFLYTYKTIAASDDNVTTTAVSLYEEFDIKAHRKLKSIDDTLFLQLAASGNAVITNYSYSTSILCKLAGS